MAKIMRVSMLLMFSLFVVVTLMGQGKSSLSSSDIKNQDGYTLTPEAIAKLNYAGQHYVDEGKLAGGVTMIAHKGKIIYRKAFGMQNIEEKQPMQMNSIFRIASMTKPMTTVGLLMLVEEGKIKLDDKAEKWLPQFATIKVLEKDGSLINPKTPVTIRHLLMHTSGTRSRADSWFRNNKINPNETKTLGEYVDMILKAPLAHHPGDGFTYAMNNDMIARIIEIITKKNFGDYMAEKLMKPLGMTSTSWIVAEKDLDRFASIYLWKDNKLTLTEGKEPVQSVFPRGNGQMVSTAEDYMKFLLMLANGGSYNGKRFLKKESVKIMTSDQLPADVKLQVGATFFPNSGFGLSVAISRNPKLEWKPIPLEFDNLFQHLPRGSYTWPGITNMFWWTDPVNEVTGVVFSQLSNPGAFGNFQDLTQTFYNDFFKVSEADQLLPLKSTATKEVWDREVQFSIDCAEIGIHQSTLKAMADDGILFKPGPVNGKRFHQANKFPPHFFKTYPESVEATLGGDLGFVTGYWSFEDNKPKIPVMSFGFFSTVWKKQEDESWKVVCATAIGGIKPTDFDRYSLNSNKWGVDKSPQINSSASTELTELEKQYNMVLAQGGDASKFFCDQYQIHRNGKLPISVSEMISECKQSKTKGWKHMEAKVAKLGDMAYTYGSFNYADSKNQAKEGYYFRFWKRDENNNWKIFMDMWN